MDKKFTPLDGYFLTYNDKVYYDFVWLQQVEINWLDIWSLKILWGSFISDKNGVYIFNFDRFWWEKVILKWIDSDTFMFFNNKYFKDKNGVYVLDKFNNTSKEYTYESIQVDIQSFTEFQDGVMADKNCFYIWQL